jgi:hypothetical protein
MSYTSSAYGYTVKYPPGWYMPTSSADNQNFSSENVGSPMALSPTGLWFYVLITNTSQADCPQTNVVNRGSPASISTIVIDGLSGTKYTFGAVVVVNVWRNHCYDLWFAVGSQPALDTNLHVIDLIVGNFRFVS